MKSKKQKIMKALVRGKNRSQQMMRIERHKQKESRKYLDTRKCVKLKIMRINQIKRVIS